MSDVFQYTPPEGPLDVIYEDESLLAFHKPSGLLSVPGKDPAHRDCLELRAKAQYPEALLVHRLDMDTSGVFLMARNKHVQGNLGKQFERRKVQKTYLALVDGLPEDQEGLIDLPLICDWPNRPRQKVCHEQGRPSQTHWHVLQTQTSYQSATLLALRPITGRSHQLRVHCMAIGHPILGDRFYAPKNVLEQSERLMLHASTLQIHNPKDGSLLRLHAPCVF